MAAFLGVADVEHGVSLLAAGGQAGEIIVGCGHGDRVSKWRCYFFIMLCCDVLQVLLLCKCLVVAKRSMGR